MLDTLNTQQIEQLLQAQRAQAATYAAQPERFALFALEGEIRTEHGKHLIMYNNGDWSCTCTFFQEWQTCCHIMALSSLLVFCGNTPALVGG